MLTDLYGYYKMYEATGVDRVDAHGNLSNMIDVNNVPYSAAGKINGCAHFDPASSHKLENRINGNMNYGAGSMNVWVTWDGSTDGFGRILRFGDGGEYGINRQAENIRVTDAAGNSMWKGVTGWGSTTWKMITVTRGGDNMNTVTVYADGVSKGGTTNSWALNPWSTTVRFWSEWDGKMCELGLWDNRVLTQDDITWLYNGGAGRTYEEMS